MISKKSLRTVFIFALAEAHLRNNITARGKISLQEIAMACADFLYLDKYTDTIKERQIRELCKEYERKGWIKEMKRNRYKLLYKLNPEISEIIKKPLIEIEKLFKKIGKINGVELK